VARHDKTVKVKKSALETVDGHVKRDWLKEIIERKIAMRWASLHHDRTASQRSVYNEEFLAEIMTMTRRQQFSLLGSCWITWLDRPKTVI
jgi:hypothetical protein